MVHLQAMAKSDVIALEGLVVNCVVGVYPHERNNPQPLRVDLYLELPTRAAGEHEKLRETVDYAAVADQVAFLLTTCRFGMLETAAHALSCLLLLPPAAGERRAQVQALRLRLTKPTALAGHAIPYLEIRRKAADIEAKHEISSFGHVDIVCETRDVGIYRLNISPGQSIPLHLHKKMQEAELVLSEGLLCQGKPVAAGAVFRWPLNTPHVYENPTAQFQTILCVDSPSFMSDDEVQVEGQPVQLDPERALSALVAEARTGDDQA